MKADKKTVRENTAIKAKTRIRIAVFESVYGGTIAKMRRRFEILRWRQEENLSV